MRKINVTTVTNDGHGATFFAEREIELSGNDNRMLSEQQAALNFRLRTSHAEYASGWHVAGDPTLLVMLSGGIRIELRHGETKQFAAGEMFIAEDYLAQEVPFDDAHHGHRAQVVGDEPIAVLHLKLAKRA